MLYLVVSRERYVQDPRDQDNAVLVRETGQNKVSVYRTIDAETKETRLYCYSDQKAKKEQAIHNRFHVRLEEALDKLNAGLDKKGTFKNYSKEEQLWTTYTLRFQLKRQGIHLSWDSIRNIMSTQQHITITLPTDANKTIHLRTTTQAETRQKQLYATLSIKPDPIGKCKTIIDKKKYVVPFELK